MPGIVSYSLWVFEHIIYNLMWGSLFSKFAYTKIYF